MVLLVILWRQFNLLNEMIMVRRNKVKQCVN